VDKRTSVVEHEANLVHLHGVVGPASATWLPVLLGTAALRRADHSSLLPYPVPNPNLHNDLAEPTFGNTHALTACEVKLLMAFPLLIKVVGRLASRVRDGDGGRALISI
jgi:hypothetical protein